MSDKEMTTQTQADVTRRPHKQERPVFVPATDIWETPDAIMLAMDMPGVGIDDVEVNVQRGMLQVRGKTAESDHANALYAEQRTGDFEREFSLSDDLDADKIDAKMHAGVLTLTISKAEKVKPKKIAITAG